MYKSEKECLCFVNKLLVDLNISIPRLSSMMQLNGLLYTIIFERLFGFGLKTSGDERNMFSVVLKTLEDILGTSVDHIKTEALCDRQIQSHFQLLEIFDSCNKYLPRRKDAVRKKTECKQKAVQTSTSNSISSRTSTTSSQYSEKSLDTSPENNSLSNFSICDCPDVIRSTPEFTEYRSSTNYNSDEDAKYEPKRIAHKLKPSEITKVIIPRSSTADSLLPNRILKPKPMRKTLVSSKGVPTKVLKTFPISTRRSKPSEVIEIGNQASKEIFDDKGQSDSDLCLSDLQKLLQALTIDNFALDIGKQLHATLKMKQKTKQIMQHIEKMNQLIDDPKSLEPVSKKQPKSSKKKVIKRSKTVPKRRQHTLTATSVSVEDLCPKGTDIPRCLLKVMRDYESKQQKVIENIEKDLKSSESRLACDLKEAITKQLRKSLYLREDVQHMQNLNRVKNDELENLTETAVNREWRLERARIHKFVENYHREMLSKLKSLEAREEKMMREEFFRRLKRQKAELLEFKKLVKEEEGKEIRKQRMFLDAFETFYNNNLDMLKENINEQQTSIKKRLLHQKTSLNKLHTEYQHQLNEQMRRICK